MKWTFVNRTSEKGPASHGMNALKKALSSKGITCETKNSHVGPLHDGLVFIGLNDEPAIFRQAKTAPAEPESFRMCKSGTSRILCAADELGLAYGLFELSEMVIDEGENALLCWPEISGKPDHKVRGVDRFITNSHDEAWWMNRDYWDFYFTMLVSSRFNSFTLVFGFDTAYFSPPYPFFVSTPGFESITVPDWIDRGKYLAALNQIGEMCHDYGLKFTVAIWQQVPWQEGQKQLVEGFKGEDELEAYCAAGLKALLGACPHIDKVHFRVNHESGVGTQVSAEAYWLKQIDAIADFNQESGRDIELELRAKGMTDLMVEHGKKRGLKLSVSTKYWCEQTGLPFHMTRYRTEEITKLDNFNHSRRYSYADMLKRPRLHKFVYRKWSNGSTNLLTWGSPDYVRRFMDSLRLGEADGFEVMPPLSYKGGHQFLMAKEPWDLFADASMQPEGFEESRYWLYYRLFGRISYSMGENEGAWMRPMRARFGKAARQLMETVSAMSYIVPYIVAYHFPTHPQQTYWAELDTGGSLFAENSFNHCQKSQGITYQSSLPSDEGLFYSIDQYTADLVAGKTDGRVTPYQSIAHLRGMVDKTSLMLAEAEKAGLPGTPEARGVALDARMLVKLGEYHIEKTHAAIGASLHALKNEKKYISSALGHMRAARDKWAKLAELGKAYHSDLNFTTGTAHVAKGTWGDALVELDADIKQLESLASGESPAELVRHADISSLKWRTDVPASHVAGKDLRVTLDIGACAAESVRLRWRRTNHLDGLFNSVPMSGCKEGLQAVIPAAEVRAEWDIMIYFEAVNEAGDALQYPGVLHADIPLPYFIVKII